MNIQAEKSDARTQTRARLIDVFNQLLLSGETPRPKVAQIIAEAGVSRSTFYDYFDGVEALLNDSLAGLLGQFAEAIIDPNGRERQIWLLDHIWQNRAAGRQMLAGARADLAAALLAQKIEEQLPDRSNRRMLSILAAGTIITALENWITRRLGGTAVDLAEKLDQLVSAILID